MPFDSELLVGLLDNMSEMNPTDMQNALVKIIHIMKNSTPSNIGKEFNSKK